MTELKGRVDWISLSVKIIGTLGTVIFLGFLAWFTFMWNTQVAQGASITSIETRIAKLEVKVSSIEENVNDVKSGVNTIDGKMDELKTLMIKKKESLL